MSEGSSNGPPRRYTERSGGRPIVGLVPPGGREPRIGVRDASSSGGDRGPGRPADRRIPTLILTRPEIGLRRCGSAVCRRARGGTSPAFVWSSSPGDDFNYWYGDRAAFVAELEEFFTGARSSAIDEQRGLATVLFTDIVGSTARSADSATTLGRGSRSARRDRPARAGPASGTSRSRRWATGSSRPSTAPLERSECARAIVEEVRLLGIEIRAGLHTGEIDTRGRRYLRDRRRDRGTGAAPWPVRRRCSSPRP